MKQLLEETVDEAFDDAPLELPSERPGVGEVTAYLTGKTLSSAGATLQGGTRLLTDIVGSILPAYAKRWLQERGYYRPVDREAEVRRTVIMYAIAGMAASSMAASLSPDYGAFINPRVGPVFAGAIVGGLFAAYEYVVHLAMDGGSSEKPRGWLLGSALMLPGSLARAGYHGLRSLSSGVSAKWSEWQDEALRARKE
ncbi:hypothetical protein J4439_04580 [Candidatus Woesearchaeota archaeon]|nr:hypothetical protein [Candidatus Woesearchaeota archaeon]